MPQVTESQILDAIREAMQGKAADDGVSVFELCEATGRAEGSIRMAIRRLIQSGQMVAGRSVRPSIDGRMSPIPVYRLLKAKGKK